MTSTTHPAALHLKAGTHALCTCGLSNNETFCDGSHDLNAETSGKIQQAWWKF